MEKGWYKRTILRSEPISEYEQLQLISLIGVNADGDEYKQFFVVVNNTDIGNAVTIFVSSNNGSAHSEFERFKKANAKVIRKAIKRGWKHTQLV